MIPGLTISQTMQEQNNLRGQYQQQQVLSPSPEMRNMIRFDNVDVSTYTGVPDINIPLYEFYCSKNLNFNLSLKYHTDAIKRQERSGSTGLGWSLFGGGSITRVVRGLPDEFSYESEYSTPRRGLHSSTNVGDGNDLDDFMNNPNAFVSSGGLSLYDKLFEGHESNVYDTQYDIYYYNFMGHSGSFYLKMNNALTRMTVVKLDNSNLKIEVNFTAVGNNPNIPDRFDINSFTIHDENGNKYIFDVIEKTQKMLGYSGSKLFDSADVYENLNNGQGVLPIDQNTKPIPTAYHLSSVTPYHSTSPILTFTYEEYKESYKDYSWIRNKLLSTYTNLTDDAFYSEIRNKVLAATTVGWGKIRNQFGHQEMNYITLITNTTKKIKRLNYNNQLYIDFTYEGGRIDKNYFGNGGDLVKLSNVEIYSADPPLSPVRPSLRNKKRIRQFKLNYSHSTSLDNKLLLKEVVEYKEGIGNEITKNHRLYYNSENAYFSKLFEDPWGYCSSIQPNSELSPKVDINNLKNLILEKIDLPTGGTIIYDYEPHTYSYIGATKQYAIGTIPNIRKTEIGGGVRIKRIGFFDDKNVSKDYYKLNMTSPLPSKELSYNYNLLNENQSSGSLAFPVPVFTYDRWYDLFGEFYGTNGVEYLQSNQTGLFKFRVTTDNNNLHTLTTNGANVGYKYITITERDNGKRILEYTSPIDFPESNYTITYPFMPSKNVDYKRGLLLSEKVYNSNNILISDTKNDYEYTDSEVIIGLIPFYRNGHNCRKTLCSENSWKRAGLINTNQINCHNGAFSMNSPSQYYQDKPYCTSTQELMDYKFEYRVVGWAKLRSTETTEYIANTNEYIKKRYEYTYNTINKKIKSEKNIIGNDVYLYETEYLNTSSSIGGFFPNIYNRISDVREKKASLNGELLSRAKVIFKNLNDNGSGLTLLGSERFAPEQSQYSKGNMPYETYQTVTRYDEVGNPIEVRDINGKYTSYIWGHRKRILIAAIDNCRFYEIEILPVYNTILSQTNSNITNENQLIGSYITLREALGSSKRVNAIIYNMGIGVVCTIDSNGYTNYYKYNSLGNLSEQRDHYNFILSQYFEFYKN